MRSDKTKGLLTCCGYRCDLCPAFQATRKNDLEALSRLSKIWEQLFGFYLESEQLLCDGCLKREGRRIDKNCPVRPCCLKKGFRTCAECTNYPCDSLKERFVTKSEIEKNIGHAIPDQLYQIYVKPFESKARLDKLHQINSK